MKIKYFAIFLLLGLGACTSTPILEAYTQDQLQAMDCRKLLKESEKLTQFISQASYGEQPFYNQEPKEHREKAAESAKNRLKQIQEMSVQKMCTYG